MSIEGRSLLNRARYAEFGAYGFIGIHGHNVSGFLEEAQILIFRAAIVQREAGDYRGVALGDLRFGFEGEAGQLESHVLFAVGKFDVVIGAGECNL